MTAGGITESVIEQAALAWLEGVGWQVRNGAELAPGEPAAEREDFGQVVLAQRLPVHWQASTRRCPPTSWKTRSAS